jgi:hypothetical protein
VSKWVDNPSLNRWPFLHWHQVFHQRPSAKSIVPSANAHSDG